MLSDFVAIIFLALGLVLFDFKANVFRVWDNTLLVLGLLVLNFKVSVLRLSKLGPVLFDFRTSAFDFGLEFLNFRLQQ